MDTKRCLKKHVLKISYICMTGRSFRFGGFSVQVFYCETCNKVRRRYSVWLNKPKWAEKTEYKTEDEIELPY